MKNIQNYSKYLLESRHGIVDRAIENKNFQKWFENSKVIDPHNRPMMVYHGTPFAGYNRFDTDPASKNTRNETNTLGSWFTDSPKVAGSFAEREYIEYYTDGSKWGDGELKQFARHMKQFGAVYPVFLSFRNPIIFSHGDLHNIEYDENHQYVIDMKLFDPFELFMDYRDQFAEYIDGVDGVPGHWRKHMIAENSKETNKKLIRHLYSLGHDSIVIQGTRYDTGRKAAKINQYIAFEPTQIKSIFNNGKWSATNPDILE